MEIRSATEITATSNQMVCCNPVTCAVMGAVVTSVIEKFPAIVLTLVSQKAPNKAIPAACPIV